MKFVHPFAAFVLALLTAAPIAGHAQDVYPSRSIRLLIPFAAGGGTDILARKFGERMSRKLGQTLVPENKAGASGVIAATEVARAKLDGYASRSTLIMSATIHRNVRKIS